MPGNAQMEAVDSRSVPATGRGKPGPREDRRLAPLGDLVGASQEAAQHARILLAAAKERSLRIGSPRAIAIDVCRQVDRAGDDRLLSRFIAAKADREAIEARTDRLAGICGWIPGGARLGGILSRGALDKARAIESQAAREIRDFRSRILSRPAGAAIYAWRRIEAQNEIEELAREQESHEAFLDALFALDANLESCRQVGLSHLEVDALFDGTLDIDLVEQLARDAHAANQARRREIQAVRPSPTSSLPRAAPPAPPQPVSGGLAPWDAVRPGPEEYLFDERPFETVPALAGNYSVPKGRVYLPVSERMAGRAVAAGAKVGPKGGLFIDIEDVGQDAIQPFLPFIARRTITPIRMDMIPGSSFGASLNNMLTQSNWDALRLPEFERVGNLCQICGEKGRRKGNSLDCHEIWRHSPPREGEAMGIQRLEGFYAICEACHLMFHLGFANVTDRFDRALDRIREVNRWSFGEAEDYFRMLSETWHEHSQVSWALDLSILADRGPLKVASGWDEAANGILMKETDYGLCQTALLGVTWQYARGDKTVRPAIDPRTFRSLLI